MKIHFNSLKMQNFLLAVGMCLILFGIYFLVAFRTDSTACTAIFLRFMCLSGGGMLLLFLSLVVIKSFLLVFVGLNLVCFGILALVIDSHVVSFGLKELWPFLVISAGLSLFPTGLYHAKRIKSIYLFPGIVLVFCGIFLLPFSLHLAGISLKKFFLMFYPLAFILMGLSLVAVFFIQQTHQKNFPYMKDDSEVENRGEGAK